jgi:transcription antitermination factor NusG
VDVERDIRRHLIVDDVKVFFPAVTKQGTFSKNNPYSNYVFTSSNLSDARVLKVEGSRFVDSVLCIPGTAGRWRTVSKLRDDELKAMLGVKDYDELAPGTPVAIVSGSWQGLEADLEAVFGDRVKVRVKLRSKSRVINLSREEIKPL